MALSQYWWTPRRDRHAFRAEAQHHRGAWVRMLRHRGTVLRNFGDELAPIMLREATGTKVRWAPVHEAEVIGIGSILELFLERGGRGLVWGSGLRQPRDRGPGLPGPALAVRGELTRDALGLDPLTPLGDPGLLARAIYRATPRDRTLVIPHFTIFNSHDGLKVLRELRSQGLTILAPSAPVDVVCKAIGRAGHLLTSSLHGLVVADALRTPVTLVDFAPTAEPRFKYQDYATSVGVASTFVPATEVLSAEGRRALAETAMERVAQIDHRIDQLVEGLYRAARAI